jgi:hypothetical protein
LNGPRYLTKLCDQLICFISDEHSEMLAWSDNETPVDNINIDIADQDLYDRLYSFEVKQTDEEEETATATDGFMVCIRPIVPHLSLLTTL